MSEVPTPPERRTGDEPRPAGGVRAPVDAMLETALRGARRLVCRYDCLRDHLDCYGAVRELTGRSAEEIGTRLADLYAILHPDDRRLIESRVRDPGALSGEFVARFRFVHPDGKSVSCEAHGDLFRSAAGGEGIRTGIIEPVGDASPLDQVQRKLTHALEVSELGEWSLEGDGQAMFRSRRAVEIFGDSADSDRWSFDAFLERIHPDDRSKVESDFQRTTDTGQDLAVEARIVRPDGDLRWIAVKASMVPVPGDGVSTGRRVIGGVIQDVTSRRFAARRDRFLADVSVPLNTLIDHRSTLEQVARLAVPLLGDYCGIDLVVDGNRLKRVVATDATLLDDESRDEDGRQRSVMVERMLESKRRVVVERVEASTLNELARSREERESLGKLGVLSYLGIPLMLRGRLIGVMHFFRTTPDTSYGERDVSVAEELAVRVAIALENARLYQEVQSSDRRKDEFLAMLSHELRNPLESLSVGVSLIESDAEVEKRDWAQRMMRGQITKLSGILDDLLDVSRYTFNRIVLDRKTVDLATVVRSALDEIRDDATAWGYAADLVIYDRPIFAEIDEMRIAQVIGNLLSNAIKYGAARGRIITELGYADGFARISVCDEGVGIEKAELPNVFELFSQVDTTIDRALGGLGMGLTLAKRIVQLHGGSVLAESEGRDQGARMTFFLPATLERRQFDRSAQRVEAAPNPGATPVGHRLMLVDDNVETVTALSRLFTMKGYEVETAHDGLAALELADRFQPDMAVLDIGLPGANGYEIASTLRQRYAGAPLLLVALSGYGQQKDRDRSREAGFDHHLLKPANFQAILEVLRTG